MADNPYEPGTQQYYVWESAHGTDVQEMAEEQKEQKTQKAVEAVEEKDKEADMPQGWKKPPQPSKETGGESGEKKVGVIGDEIVTEEGEIIKELDREKYTHGVGEESIGEKRLEFSREHPDMPEEFQKKAFRYQQGMLSESEYEDFTRMAKGRQPSWEEYQAYKQLREEGPGSFESYESYSNLLPFLGSTDRGEWERARDIYEGKQRGFLEETPGGGVVPAEDLTRSEFRRISGLFEDYSYEEYRQGQTLEDLQERGLVEQVETEEGTEYRLTKSPSKLSVYEERLVEEAGFEMPAKGPSRELYEWAEGAREGTPRSEFGEFGAMVLGEAISTATAPITLAESLIPGKQPGEEWLTQRQRVGTSELMELESMTEAQEWATRVGGISSSYIGGYAAGAGIGAGVEAAAPYVPGAVSAVGSKLSGRTAQIAGGAAIGGLEAGKIYSMAQEGKSGTEIATEVGTDIAGVAGFIGGYGTGRSAVRRFRALGEGGGYGQQQISQEEYEALQKAARQGDIDAIEKLRAMGESVEVTPEGAIIEESRALALQRFQQAAQTGPTVLTPVGIRAEQETKPLLETEQEEYQIETEADLMAETETEQIETIGDLMEKQSTVLGEQQAELETELEQEQRQRGRLKQEELIDELEQEQRQRQKLEQKTKQQTLIQEQAQKQKQRQKTLVQELVQEQAQKQKQKLAPMLTPMLAPKQAAAQKADLKTMLQEIELQLQQQELEQIETGGFGFELPKGGRIDFTPEEPRPSPIFEYGLRKHPIGNILEGLVGQSGEDVEGLFYGEEKEEEKDVFEDFMLEISGTEKRGEWEWPI